MVPKAAVMGTPAESEGRSGGGAWRSAHLRLDSDSVAKRGVKHHHQPAPRLRFVPPKEEPAPNEGVLCWTSPSSAAGCTTDSSTPVGAHTLSLRAGSESPPMLRSSSGRTYSLGNNDTMRGA
jgi:hypothetical protein